MARHQLRNTGRPLKILLFGKAGQVGWELQRSLAPLGDVVALDRAVSRELCGDLSNAAAIAETVRQVRPNVIINAAAYTAVDKAESEPTLAHAINAVAPGVLAREAAAIGAWLVHYSTDYVFDGSGDTARAEDDPTGPLNEYGRSKLEGEQLVRSSGCRHLLFRTSWVYGVRGQNFPKTMLRLAAERDALAVIDDQYGAPTSAELLADSTAHAIRTARRQPECSGLYHLAASGETTWYGYATYVIERARAAGRTIKVAADAVRPVPTSAYPTAARRPANSRLDTRKFRQTFDLVLPDWKHGVDRLLDEIIEL